MRTLGDDRQDVGAAIFSLLAEARTNCVEIIRQLRNETNFRTTGEGGHHGEVAAVTAHDLDDKSAGKRGGGIADRVHGLTDHVKCGVHAEAVISAGDVIIDGGGYAGEGDAEVGVKLIERAK